MSAHILAMRAPAIVSWAVICVLEQRRIDALGGSSSLGYWCECRLAGKHKGFPILSVAWARVAMVKGNRRGAKLSSTDYYKNGPGIFKSSNFNKIEWGG
jgi:hypothetical protein